MSDLKNQGNGGRKTSHSHLTIKTNPSLVFNRSMTTLTPSSSAAEDKHRNPRSYQRNTSINFFSASKLKGKVRKMCSFFESPKRHPSSSLESPTLSPSQSPTSPPDSPNLWDFSPIRLPGTEDRVVIYFTSLRGIRRTFHDCQSVRMVFRGFRINLDERDVSMDVAYKNELQELFGEDELVTLPQVFIKGKHIGGAEVALNLVEAGELVRMIKGLPFRSLKPCDVCGDMRFIACVNCGGSRKVYDEKKEQTNRCTVCNENGLMRCPLCSS
ncbi:hypothetical protein SASPL_125203 [Salvia splendens]|uniref:Glutaredoxin domain-containing protein n=1 Tax=Salvia splendens TaxID=180675 RepID=A0A8X8XH82_SALSN|nr:uncharacterized protein At5g39865-like [Salvia splendens]KAG6412524.1 hypothetical protein SASPL_125203 [Salvia splendens]